MRTFSNNACSNYSWQLIQSLKHTEQYVTERLNLSAVRLQPWDGWRRKLAMGF